jgi:hypothetical protein
LIKLSVTPYTWLDMGPVNLGVCLIIRPIITLLSMPKPVHGCSLPDVPMEQNNNIQMMMAEGTNLILLSDKFGS